MYTKKITAMAWAKLNFPEQIEALKLVFHLFASEFYYFLLYFLHHWDKSDKAVVWIFVNKCKKGLIRKSDPESGENNETLFTLVSI